MTDDNSNPPAQPLKRSPPGKVGGRLKRCIDAMIWENLTDSQAAVKFKMNVNSIRSGLKRAPVLRYLREQRQVLLNRELGRNSHVLIQVRDTSPNGMARIAAVRELERVADDEQHNTLQRAPGITIIIEGGPGGDRRIGPPVVDITPIAPSAHQGDDDDPNAD